MQLQKNASIYSVVTEMNQEIEDLKERVQFLERTAFQQSCLIREITITAQVQADQFGRLLNIVNRMLDR